jgi:hypothetical protein
MQRQRPSIGFVAGAPHTIEIAMAAGYPADA